jgi:hypothetical protein
MHDHGHVEPPGKQLRGREMVCVSVRVNEIPDAQPILGSKRKVAIHLTEFGIYQRRRAGLLAADHVGPAASHRHCFEYHRRALLDRDSTTNRIE